MLSMCSTTELHSKPEFLEICICVLIIFNSVVSMCEYTCKSECRCWWRPEMEAPLELELQACGSCLMYLVGFELGSWQEQYILLTV